MTAFKTSPPLLALLAAPLLATTALAQEFPLTITHKFGETVIAAQPQRVATVDYNGADNILALGLQPLTVRDWFGNYPRGVWPWADAVLEDDAAILRGELNFEQVAATAPDVIIALYSGITAEEYEQLSLIAPVVAVPEGVGDYELGWQEQALIVGRALGLEDDAQAQVSAIEERMAAIAAAHPEWAEQTVALGTVWEGAAWIYTTSDPRVVFLNQLGFDNLDAVEALSTEGTFSVEVSYERPEVFDADVLVWFADEGVDPILNAPFRPSIVAAQEGRELLLGPLVTSALSHTSLLSLPYALDVLEPSLALATDGDPATEVAVTE